MFPKINDNLLVNHCNNNQIINVITYKIKSNYTNILTGGIKISYMHIIKKFINIQHDFRYTYYCLKLKKHFKRWLWERVREPKIKKQFHPVHLNTLNETDDLEEYIENWINSVL
jgi:hypothetical protein